MTQYINELKMKKQIFAFLMAILMLFALAGCAKTETTASPSPSASDSAAIHMPDATADMTHSIGLSGVSNARDIGGYKTADGKTVKVGMLLRTGELGGAADADKKILTDTYHVEIIIDLRCDSEIAQSPELTTLPGVTNIHIPVLKDVPSSPSGSPSAAAGSAASSANPDQIDELVNNVLSTANTVYASMVTDEYSINAFKQFFETVLSTHDGAISYHCVGGKDRTGVASMLLLSALGVDRQTVEADYLLTNDFIKSSIDGQVAQAAAKGADQATQDNLKLLLGTDKEWADTVFDTIDTKYGSMVNFLQEELDVTPAKIDQLKQMYLQ